MIMWLLIAPVLIFIGLAGYLYFMQARLVYFPVSEIEGTPNDIHLEYEDVAITTSDGVKITGWFIPAQKSIATVLFCHGNGGNISHRLMTILGLHELGFDLFLFDYRGYGWSEGTPSESGTYLDAETAWRYLTEQRRIDPKHIIIHGRSLGGCVAAHLAGSHRPAVLILEETPTSIPEVGVEIYPFFPLWLMRLLSRYDYNTSEHLAAVKCPVLVIHSSGDEMIPFRHGRRLFGAAGEPKAFIELTGSHNDAFIISGKVYKKRLAEFVTKHIEQ